MIYFSAMWKIFWRGFPSALVWQRRPINIGEVKRQGASTKRLLPVQEFFAHIRDAHEFYAALVKSGKMNDMQALARGFFARSIEGRLQLAGLQLEPMQLSAHACALAGSVFSLLDWRMDKGMKADPKEMDDLFHRIAWTGLAAR
jgi:hypothetical protein